MASPTVPFVYTRKDYLNGACTHQQYYSQLVRPALVQQVKDAFGIKTLTSSKNDGHFNHISLDRWDSLAFYSRHMPNEIEWKMVEDFPTQAGLVCIAKQAARMAVEQEQQ